MPLVNGKAFPYTKKGMEAASRAGKGKGSTAKTPGTMTNNPQQNAMANAEQEKSKKMDAMRNALSKAAAAKGNALSKAAPSAPKANMPAQAGVSGTPDFMPIKRGDALKKKNLAE